MDSHEPAVESSGPLTGLVGKLLLVTGAGVGLGQGIALELARQGADVALHYYGDTAAGAQALAAQVEALGRRAVVIEGDLSRVGDCRRVVDAAAAGLGGLDGLVNNAGVVAARPFEASDEALFDRVYAVNIRGSFFCAQSALPHLQARGAAARAAGRRWAGGSIVNNSSVHGLAGFAGHAVYAGSKGAVNAWTRELAVELCAAHVRVNAVAPGSIEVPWYWETNPSYTRAQGDRQVPWGRVGLPADVAYATAFLLSDAAEFITGQVLCVDGGLTAKLAIPR